MQNKSVISLYSNFSSFFSKNKNIKLMEEYIGKKVIDILFYLPLKIIHHDICNKWEDLEDNKRVILKIFVQKHYNSFRIRNAPYKIKTIFCNNQIMLVFFSKNTGYLRKIFPEGTEIIICGKINIFNKKYQINHPVLVNFEVDMEKSSTVMEPVYRQRKGLKTEFIRSIIKKLLSITPEFKEWNKNLLLLYKDIPSWKNALLNIHIPRKNQYSLEKKCLSHLRLAYDELLASQLSLILVRNRFNKKKSNKYNCLDKYIFNSFLNSLPFSLTFEQKNILNIVIKDLLKQDRMNRLIHGDVGTGKTILAIISAFYVIKSKFQVAILAPTELLAKQHFELAIKLFKNFNIKCGLLVSSSLNKNDLLRSISNADINLVIGTHSLIQKSVEFKCLSLIIIDEQHRFGVEQRLRMREKGNNVDMLLLSATPIPRTLMLAALGDIDISILRQKPNKSEIKTILKSDSKILEILEYLKNQLNHGKKAFWVCPTIDAEDELEKSNVVQRYNSLKKEIKEIGILHGKMNSYDKNNAINQFKKGKIKVLVTTVVIEVGIDIPDANIIIIEKAETFGLAQIHQLRGRVGRGLEQGICILLFNKNLNENAYERLLIMKSTNNGFIIAEKDLEMRGGGEILGIKQYGYENFLFFDYVEHSKLVRIANKEAKSVLQADPNLTSDRGIQLRNLLYIFKKDEILDLISAG